MPVIKEYSTHTKHHARSNARNLPPETLPYVRFQLDPEHRPSPVIACALEELTVANHHTVFFELRDALSGPGCAICTLALRQLTRYFGGLGYERVNDRGLRSHLRASRGFCPVHGHRLYENRMALGTAIIHRDILNTLREDLASNRSTERAGILGQLFGNDRAGADPLAPQQECPACIKRRKAEQLYIDTLIEHLPDDTLHSAMADSVGLCLPHLRTIMGRAPATLGRERLRQTQGAIWGRLIAELDEFIRKQDHQFTHEPAGAENDAWARAVALVTSHPQLGRRHDE